MKKLAILFALGASPAFAASGPFFSLYNTNFVVLIAFLLFVGVLIYFGVPKLLGDTLDKRAADIQSELDEARALREEAQALLASYERKQKEVAEQAERIVEHAKMEANEAAELAKVDLQKSIERRLAAADEQITSAQTSAVKDVRDRAIQVAVEAAAEVVAKKMTAAEANKLIETSIADVETKLH